MNIEKSWDKEYLEQKMLSVDSKPLSALLTYLRFLKKVKKVNIAGFRVLDLGCGVGRNSNYLSSLGCEVVGIDISGEALKIARKRSQESSLKIKYIQGNIGAKYPFADKYFDLIIDATSSNALNEKEREIYLSEVSRTLSDGGYFFVRALLKDGDKNAQNLIKISPGPERDTYFMKELGLTERVFAMDDFLKTYKKFFTIDKMIKSEGRVRISNKIFKRKYIVAYLSAKK